MDSVKLIHKAGVIRLVECGPGKVLCGLIKRIEPEMACFGTDDEASLNHAVAEMSA
jgi:[acyl-carrier-protein] S-malonyltransferase